jgi:hypothetical protein
MKSDIVCGTTPLTLLSESAVAERCGQSWSASALATSISIFRLIEMSCQLLQPCRTENYFGFGGRHNALCSLIIGGNLLLTPHSENMRPILNQLRSKRQVSPGVWCTSSLTQNIVSSKTESEICDPEIAISRSVELQKYTLCRLR